MSGGVAVAESVFPARCAGCCVQSDLSQECVVYACSPCLKEEWIKEAIVFSKTSIFI